MIDPDIGQEYLDHFDETLDLSKPPDRRVGVQVMIDFYGTIMARVGVKALNFDDTITGPNIVKQWEAVTSKFRSLDVINIPGDFHRIIRDLYHNLRNSTAHNFIYDPPKDVLTESRSVAEEWRLWFLDAAETYNDSFGAYSTVEYENMVRHMRDPLYAYDYVYVAVQLEMEVEHAVRNVLKSKGIAPMKHGLRGSVRTAVREGILDEDHQKQYNDLKKLVRETRKGMIDYTFSDNYEEVEWNPSEDATHQELSDASNSVHRVMDLLEYVHSLQSPFIDSQ